MENHRKIKDSKCNRWYKEIKEEGIPSYLKKGWKEERWKRILTFRMGNEVKESLYWKEQEKRKCRICEIDEETWEHIWERCIIWRE